MKHIFNGIGGGNVCIRLNMIGTYEEASTELHSIAI